MKGGTAILVLALLGLLGGGAAWMVYAQQRRDDAHAFTLARIGYVGKNSLNRLRERLALQQRKLALDEEDKRVFREAQEAQEAYIKACRKCAPAAECEQDLERIEEGHVSIANSDSYNPCE